MVDDRGQTKRRRPRRAYAYKTHLKKESLSSTNKWKLDVCGDVESLELATTARERLRGMLFRAPDKITRLLVPCHDIHTFGMTHPLDVAFISKDGTVLDVHRNVAGMKRLCNKNASLVAERFSQDGEWLTKGDVIRIGI